VVLKSGITKKSAGWHLTVDRKIELTLDRQVKLTHL
jgi:hypothetical protein